MLRLIPSAACGIALVLAALPASAQTTQTERAAAGDVIKEIDALQAKLTPAKLAERLTTARNPEKDKLVERVGVLWDGDLQSLSDWIGRNPEVGW